MNPAFENAILEAQQQFAKTQVADDNDLIDVGGKLIAMLHTPQWSIEQKRFLQAWLKKIDIAKKHYALYQNDWTPCSDKTALPVKLYQLTMLMALRFLADMQSDAYAYNHTLKLSNVIYKLMNLTAKDNQLSHELIENHINQLLATLEGNQVDATAAFSGDEKKPAELAITVLFWDGPIARAYLETIKSMGMKVKKIIKLVSAIDLVSKKPVAQWLPKSMRVNYAANKQFKQIFYWPSRYIKQHPKLVSQLKNEVSSSYGFSSQYLDAATTDLNLSEYCSELESLAITGLRDAKLQAKLRNEEEDLFLFTGGGIVPDELLAIDQKKLIHIHPGYLPEIRGADCVLWSQMLAQRLSASAFFLAPGIDVGDVLLACWLPDLELNFKDKVDDQVKYRMIYGFLDPWVRSYVLKQTILKTQFLTAFEPKSQSEDEGMTYHFMHEKMKQKSFAKLGWSGQ